MTPTVSVVIPCYNLGEYLDEAVQSVLAQTYQDFEILIVDDGSTDERTRTLLAAYTPPKTRIIRTENRGLPAAKNAGAAATTGRYLCMLDADDRLDPLYMEKSIAVLGKDATCAFVSHWLRTFGDETHDWTPERCDFPALLDVNTVNGAALVRRQALEAVGGFDESMRDGCEDWDFWISLVERGHRGHILPEVLFHYRRRPGSMSKTMVKDAGHSRLYAFLARKHAEAFRTHLPALVARRSRDEATLRAHLEDLNLEHHEWAAPELAKRRDDLAAAERRVSRHAELLERQTIDAELTVMRETAARLETARAQATTEALRFHAESSRAVEEAAALKRSLSWRITKPLRWVADRFRGGRA
jgi:glycosyltransferase involved in cell wall biosynthesis